MTLASLIGAEGHAVESMCRVLRSARCTDLSSLAHSAAVARMMTDTQVVDVTRDIAWNRGRSIRVGRGHWWRPSSEDEALRVKSQSDQGSPDQPSLR